MTGQLNQVMAQERNADPQRAAQQNQSANAAQPAPTSRRNTQVLTRLIALCVAVLALGAFADQTWARPFDLNSHGSFVLVPPASGVTPQQPQIAPRAGRCPGVCARREGSSTSPNPTESWQQIQAQEARLAIGPPAVSHTSDPNRSDFEPLYLAVAGVTAATLLAAIAMRAASRRRARKSLIAG